MKLTLQTDYALRILMALASEPHRIISVEEIAQKFSISKNHLMKVARALMSSGYVKTLRGRNGGMRLAKPAEKIAIGDVVCAIEPDMNMVACYTNTECALLPNCRLKPLIGTGVAAFIHALNQKSLSDLC